MNNEDFQNIIWQYAKDNTRTMPWRSNTDPYYVLVSEIMLQQTQVDRVVPKFDQFILRFPDIEALASAKLSEVLREWSGLGYSRRAKFLHQSAGIIKEKYNGVIPSEIDELVALPGIGPNTAGAILAYALNQPVAFVETNIRTVYLHHFFPDQDDISDAEILKKVEQTLDQDNPRQWHWALMDYGTYLKKQGMTHIRRSKHYKKQSPFQGSVRQVRGQILRSLAGQPLVETKLRKIVEADERFTPALQALLAEGFIKKNKNIYSLV